MFARSLSTTLLRVRVFKWVIYVWRHMFLGEKERDYHHHLNTNTHYNTHWSPSQKRSATGSVSTLSSMSLFVFA